MSESFIWIIAGSILQIPIIQEAQRRGYKVIVSDRNPNADGVLLADEYLDLDTYDVHGHEKAAARLKESGRKIAAVLTTGADVGPTVSAVAWALGLPAAPYKVAVRCRDKTQMRATLQAEHPKSISMYYNPNYVSSMVDAIWKHEIEIPFVVKPAENCATRGISVVKRYDMALIADAFAKADAANKQPNRILIEELLEPICEVATDSLVYNGKAHFANGVYRYFHQFGIEAGHLNPLTPDADLLAKIQDAASKLGVEWGPFKCDFILDKRYGWVLVECATRLSGAWDHSVAAPIATGRDITGAMLDMALGMPLDISKITPKWDKWCFTYAPVYEPGPITSWAHIAEAKATITGIHHVFVRENAYIAPLKDCAARPIFIMAEGDTAWQAMRRAVAASKIIRPIRR